ncbi:MAG: 23S rRNA (adenine(2503)-C(2))-methyltransferase RlmN, partial [Anaerolineae bacterium]
IYRNLWASPHQFTNLPKGLRERLAETLRWEALTPVTGLASQDGQTVKTLFRLDDGRQIEAVLMKYGDVESASDLAGERRKKRRTLCISTQVGCGMGCVFCATGQMGWKRNLSSGEIVAQVLYYARLLHEAGERVTNIVVMGMGEPFHNYENTMAAIDRLNDARGFSFGARRITLSTVGLVPQIRRFADERRQVNLAVSLHAADDALRASLLPIARKYPLDELLDACRYYTTRTHRRITFEWALIEGVNDSPEQARLLAQKVRGLLCHVNIIPLNPTHGYKGRGSTRRRAEMFRETLEQAGVPCTIRLRRGVEIQAGCGQLAAGEK